MNEDESGLRCPNCKKKIAIGQILESCSVAWPNQKWIWYDCKKCKYGCHVEVRENELAIGDIDGAPGPCFMETDKSMVTGMKTKVTSASIIIRFAGKKYQFPAKQ